jgi:Sec-independent protein secretion pathway component TatC
MYHKAIGACGVTTAAFSQPTGMNLIWLLLAMFTLLAAGLAIGRLIPRRNRPAKDGPHAAGS